MRNLSVLSFAAASNNAVDSKRKADTWKRNRRALVCEQLQSDLPNYNTLFTMNTCFCDRVRGYFDLSSLMAYSDRA